MPIKMFFFCVAPLCFLNVASDQIDSIDFAALYSRIKVTGILHTDSWIGQKQMVPHLNGKEEIAIVMK